MNNCIVGPNLNQVRLILKRGLETPLLMFILSHEKYKFTSNLKFKLVGGASHPVRGT